MRNLARALLWVAAAGVAARGGVVYTCDPSITNLSPNICSTLNTTIAGLYSAAFTNASANIYVEVGNAALGYSWATYYSFSYNQYRNALLAVQSSANDATGIANSLPATNPFGNEMVELPNALIRALGLGNPTGGIDVNLGTCNRLGTSGCYDGVVVITGSLKLYLRTGTITQNAYDLYSVVEHETDEILGTGSCAFGCGNVFDAADLFRYHSNGTRAGSAGTNAACTVSSATNACFSLDGTHMLLEYNNINNGDDAGDWVTDCTAQWVQDAERCPGIAGVDISVSAEILVLDVVGYKTQPSVQQGSYPCTNTTMPEISFVDSASGYGGYSYFAPGSWLEIKGTNLADPADPRLPSNGGTGQWTAKDFTNTVDAPTSLDGVSVLINGKPAYVWYISAGQLNVQAPLDTAGGGVSIMVTNCKAQSPAAPFTLTSLAPGMLAPSNYTANGTQYMVATFVSDGQYVLNSSVGAGFGLKSRPAKPGEQVIAYGVGFGTVTPETDPGVIEGQGNALANPVTFSFNSTVATTTFAGLAGGFVGLYEFYINVPTGLANADYKITVTQNGKILPQTMYLTVHN